MNPVSAIILAAGKGQRFASAPKALLRHRERSFLEIAVKELRLAGVTEIRAVTGAFREEVEAEAKRLQVSTVHNPRFEDGMHGSLRVGLEALTGEWKGALISLVDQPFLWAEDYRKLIEAFLRNPLRLVRPVYSGEPGNPAILPRAFLGEIQAEPPGDHGCAYLFKRHSAAVLEVPMERDACRIDIDRPEDYSRHLK